MQAAQDRPQDQTVSGQGPQGPRRGRPRSAAVERAILDAVVELLEAGEPLAGLSIERIARTAGVGKATIYRRWSGKEELFVDVLRDIEPAEPTVSGTAGLDDLRLLLESMRTRGLAQRSSVLLHNVFAQMKSHPKLWAEYQGTVIAPRRVALTAAVRRAVEAGELRADLDVELMNDLFLGPMLVRTVHRPDAPLPEDLVDRIIEVLLQGLAPKPRVTTEIPATTRM
ncbi:MULTISPECIES: TetR/AcrR family transcriptional regulator [Streptomyces]|uniref:AcrR family transcriptional regulator n=1 Tax=Streptomyces clavifer TaxID=68188 RepID=A0ABS4VCY5_9ACTN|nr:MULTISPECIES: TetR/AcrR family transcriptional regulator [Streptomyces]KQX79311.1 TetR family transcriptional regulator [Streptomyces sp. Root1319]KQZ21171.1 TetR family transcriptional regulator [Streptomyces sp. Root55]MBP2361712.1 AcrR family transcriptional regulator [Streptomyces clavifer]MDX2743914.1 TetR/AcrR family transcriptional regulator [Streptomyces sp. NRRL_B-2557]MDX3061539.1 TetR/AcrR family transcriptional regulator [Streptomyces sp. ND04-05B]